MDITARSAWLFAAVSVAACIDSSDSVSETTQAAKTGCPSWGCGGNSPLIGPYQFHELDEKGAPNDAGMRLVGFLQNGLMYQVDVVADKLYARSPRVTLSGTQLVGGKFEVDTPPQNDYPGGRVEIEITHVSENVTFWMGPATPVETYELYYTGPSVPIGSKQAVCLDPPDARDGEGTSNPERYETIFYTGDRYDAVHKYVTASSYAAAGTWFNFACAGSALAKLHLNRHTTASAITGYTTSAAERQTMLKMYTGDFCGHGEPYTQQGTALHWKNSKGWSSPVIDNVNTYESLWSSNGAVCLNTHRLHGLSPIDYQADIQGSPTIKGECPKVDCYTLPGFPNQLPSNTYILTQSAALP